MISRATGLALSDVEVRCGPSRTRTDTTGEFALQLAGDGMAHVVFRRLGYVSRDSAVQVHGGDSVFVVMTMSPTALSLDTLQVTAPGNAPWLLPEFEERRRRGEGRYLSREQLRKLDDRGFADVLRSTMPSLGFIEANGETYAYSRRTGCFVQIVWDGMPIYRNEKGAQKALVDLASVFTRDFDGVEYYASPVTTPMQYRSVGSRCGTLILWSRRR